MRSFVLSLAAIFIAPAALAAEPSGCDKFAWPLEKERQMLSEAQEAALGSLLDRDGGRAVKIELQPLETAKLVNVPARKPKNTPSFAGYVNFGAARAGRYKISLSEGAWIDVIQDTHDLKSVAFTGATDCPNIRKSVKFELGADPFTLQVSDAPSPAIAVVVTPAE
jgi:hypothetical protein